MGNTFVDRHFQHFGVDHQQADIACFSLVKQRQNHGVDTNRLSGARGTGYQHVRHLGQVGHHRIAHDVFAEAHCQHGLGFVIDLRAQNFGEFDALALGVGQFQRHVIFPGNGFHHPNRYQAKRTRQVFGQADDLRALYARCRFDLVTGNHRTWLGQHHAHLYAKVLELLFDHAAGHFQRFRSDGFLAQLRSIEQIDQR